MPETNARDNDMKRFTQLLLAIVAVSLISWYTDEKPKPLPPDDPADVAVLTATLGEPHVKLDADGNVEQVALNGPDLQNDARVAPAIRRLRHVRSLAGMQEADAVLRAVPDWPSLESACLTFGVTDDGLACLERMKNLKELRAPGADITDKGAKSIAKLKNLKRLYLQGSPLMDEGAKSIAKLKNLESLDIQDARITDAALKEFATLPKLKILGLKRCAVTDAGLEYLKGMKLEELNVPGTKITNRGIACFEGMTTLKVLDVNDTKVTEAGCAKLKQIPGLEVSGALEKEVHEVPDDPKEVAALEAAVGSFDKDNVTDNVHVLQLDYAKNPSAWMRHLKGLHNLNTLTLPFGGVGDDDLAQLAGLKSLQYLNAERNEFSDAGLKHIGKLTNLRLLALSHCPNITSAGMKHLGELKNLENLDLDGTAIGDEGLRHLSKLKNLRGLALSNTKVTDAGLAHLADMVNLEGLSLGGTQTTDSGLVHLYGLKKLSSFGKGAGMTLDGLKELNKHAPLIHLPEPQPVPPRVPQPAARVP